MPSSQQLRVFKTRLSSRERHERCGHVMTRWRSEWRVLPCRCSFQRRVPSIQGSQLKRPTRSRVPSHAFACQSQDAPGSGRTQSVETPHFQLFIGPSVCRLPEKLQVFGVLVEIGSVLDLYAGRTPVRVVSCVAAGSHEGQLRRLSLHPHHFRLHRRHGRLVIRLHGTPQVHASYSLHIRQKRPSLRHPHRFMSFVFRLITAFQAVITD